MAAGASSAAEGAAARAHLVQCPECRSRFSQLISAQPPLDGLEPVPPGVLERLLRAATPERQFSGMAPEFGQLMDLTEASAQRILEGAFARRALWVPLPFPGCSFRPIRSGGPRVAGARRFFVRLRSGARFPHHPHTRNEELLVLQGGARDNQGREFWRGESIHTPAGTWHGFGALGPLACICAVVQTKVSPGLGS